MWRIISPQGLCIRKLPSIDSQKVGLLLCGDTISGTQHSDWVLHDKGWSMVSHGDNHFLEFDKGLAKSAEKGLMKQKNHTCPTAKKHG